MSTSSCELKFMLSADHEDFVVSVTLDDEVIYQGNPGTDWKEIRCVFSDDDRSHVLSISLSGKSNHHTLVNDAGEIVRDYLVKIKDISLDGIDVNQLVSSLARYTHDSNGNGPEITEPFYDCMGCNGQVKFEFSTPIYLWLLENM